MNQLLIDVPLPIDLLSQVAIVLGNEVIGVDTQVMAECDKVVEIPTFGVKNSLNVASACPVVVFEVLRQWEAFPTTRTSTQAPPPS